MRAHAAPAASASTDPDGRAGDATVSAVDPRDPQRLLEARQTVSALEQGLQRLSPTAAQVVLLRQVEGWSNDETALRLRLEPSQVPAILHRARRRLRRTLCLSRAGREPE